MRLSTYLSFQMARHSFPYVRLPMKAFNSWCRLALSALLAVTMLLIGGCTVLHSTVNGIPEDESAAIKAGKKSVVLFRLAPRLLDNTLVTPADKAIDWHFPFFIFWANIDRRDAPQVLQAHSPSKEAAAGNWVYYAVPPGAYWIGVRGEGGRTTWQYGISTDISRRESPIRSDFFLEVPEGVPLLYGGTLSAPCLSVRKLFGSKILWCGGVSIADESEAAEIVAQRDLRGVGPMETILLRPPKGRALAEKAKDLAPMAVIRKGASTILAPDWKMRDVGRATGLGSETLMGLLQPSSGGQQLSHAEMYVYLGYFAYLPFGAAAGLIGGQHAEREWSPCMNTLAAGVNNWSPPDALRSVLVEALALSGVDNITAVENASSIFGQDGQPRFRTLFEVEVQEVVLRECGQRWTFCGEMKVRGRLRDLATGRTLYDGILVYSNGSRRYPFAQLFYYARPYEWLVYSGAMCRAIADYCDANGVEFLLDDLNAAVRFLAHRLILEAGVPPGRSGAPESPGPEDIPPVPPPLTPWNTP